MKSYLAIVKLFLLTCGTCAVASTILQGRPILVFSQNLMSERSLRRSIVTKECSFDQVQSETTNVNNATSRSWVLMGFQMSSASDCLEVIASGSGPVVSDGIAPKPLFVPSTLCYGLYHLIDEKQVINSIISFSWKGAQLPVSLRSKYTEHNSKIQEFLGASLHIDIKKENDLRDEALYKLVPPKRRSLTKSQSKLMIGTKKCEFSNEIREALATIQSNSNPFNWMLCEYEDQLPENDNKLILVDMGMSGLQGLKGIGGIVNLLKIGKTMYLYMRMDLPMHFRPEESVPKYVLVTWQGFVLDGNRRYEIGKNPSLHSIDNLEDNINFKDKEIGKLEQNNGKIKQEGEKESSQRSYSALLGQAHAYANEIYRFFPHHIHFFASTMSELSEEVVLARLRAATDSDGMLLRVVCVQSSGDFQPAICVEIPRDSTVQKLRQILKVTIGIPEESQRIVWIHSEDSFVNGKWCPRSVATLLDSGNAHLRDDIGVDHGDKIHIEHIRVGDESPLARIIDEVNSGHGKVSLSAERRHEVERGVQAQEEDLRSRLSVAHKLILEKIASRRKIYSEEEIEIDSVQQPIAIIRATKKDSPKEKKDLKTQKDDIPHRYSEVEVLEKQVKELEAQNEHLEIPYDSIRILQTKGSELGCGRAATVYRGLWMSKNGAIEVAVKKFRYSSLTEKVVKEYRFEVALLRKLRHPNIVLFIGACTFPTLLILTEYCARGSLHSIIHNKEVFNKIPWKWKVRMALDAARGIKYLHSVSIIHRDIKSHNMLVDDEWRLKVADFGISKVLDENTQAYTQCGTTGWVAPEVLVDEEEGYSFRADNWSFSIVLWEIIAGDKTNLFIGMAPLKFYRLAKQGKRPEISNDVCPDFASLIRDCWHADPCERPSFLNIVERLEKIALDLDMDITLPLSFKGGYLE